MNNKIYELAKQAGLIEFETIPGSNAVTPDYESVVKAKKFAELIVRQCADIAKGEPASFYDRDAYKLGRKFASEDVLKHFGVEE